MTIESKIINRNQYKTSEGEFSYELQNLYELSPKMSEPITESAKRYLVRDKILKEGQEEVKCNILYSLFENSKHTMIEI